MKCWPKEISVVLLWDSKKLQKKKKKNEDACLDMSVAMVSWSSRKFAGGRQPVW